MYKFPSDTELGHLEFERIFLYYEIPRLLTCKSNTNERYLALSVNDELDKGNYNFVWLFLKLSDLTYEKLLNHDLDLKQAFLNPDSNFVYRLTQNDERNTVVAIRPMALSNDELPNSGMYLTAEKEQSNSTNLMQSLQNLSSWIRNNEVKRSLTVTIFTEPSNNFKIIKHDYVEASSFRAIRGRLTTKQEKVEKVKRKNLSAKRVISHTKSR